MEPIYIALIVLGCALFIALACLFVWFSNSCIKRAEYRVETQKSEGERTIVHLSDLHAKRFGKGNKRLVARIEKERPDFIVVTGDIIHKYRERDIAVAEEIIKKLKNIAPVYYVSGNHEMRSTRYRELKKLLVSAGANVLDDETVLAFGMAISGVNCASIKKGKFFELADGEEGFKLLLTHLPQYIDRYALAGYDLCLCGHAHGGQWRIPFTKIGIFSPGQGLFPKYSGESHSCGNMTQIISRGLGNSECPLRLFNRPELVVVKIIGK